MAGSSHLSPQQRQADLCEFKATWVYIVISRQPGLHGETLVKEREKKIQTQTKQTKNSPKNLVVWFEEGVSQCLYQLKETFTPAMVLQAIREGKGA